MLSGCLGSRAIIQVGSYHACFWVIHKTSHRRFLIYQIRRYLSIHVTLPPKAIVLVAILLPAGYTQSSIDAISSVTTSSMSSDDAAYESASTADTSDSVVVPGAEDDPLAPLLVGTVELSFSESTRYKYMTLNPPAVRLLVLIR